MNRVGHLKTRAELKAIIAPMGFTLAQLARGRAVVRKSDGVRGRIARSNTVCPDVVSVLWRPVSFKDDPWGDCAEPINIADIRPAAGTR